MVDPALPFVLTPAARELLEWARARGVHLAQERNTALAHRDPSTLSRAARELEVCGLLSRRSPGRSRSTVWESPHSSHSSPHSSHGSHSSPHSSGTPRAPGSTSSSGTLGETFNVTLDVAQRALGGRDDALAREALSLVSELRELVREWRNERSDGSIERRVRTVRREEGPEPPTRRVLEERRELSEPIPSASRSRPRGQQWAPQDATGRTVLEKAAELRALSNRDFAASFAVGCERDLCRFPEERARFAVQSALLRVAKGDAFKRRGGGQSSPMAAVFAVCEGKIDPEPGSVAPLEEVLALVDQLGEERARRASAEGERRREIEEKRERTRAEDARQRAALGLPPLREVG